MLPRLEKGCCGSSLHTASLVIAWIQVMLSSISIIILSITGGVLIEVILQNRQQGGNVEIDPKLVGMLCGILIAIIVVGLLINLGLLIGIYKRNYCIMMPYLILCGLGNVLNILSTIVLFFAAFANPVVFVEVLIHGCFTAFSCYCWLILYAHFQEIKEAALTNQNEFQKV